MTEVTEKHAQYITLSSGRKLCYAEYGAENGLPLLYFHGWPSSRLQARTLDTLGKELGVTIYAPDRPGLGKSENQLNRRLHDISETVEDILTQLRITDKVHLLGVSGGGPYALATACALNDRVSSTSIVCGAPPLAEFKDNKGMNPTYRLLLQLRPVLPALLKPALPITKWVASKTYQEPPLSWFVKTLAPADQKIFLEDKATLFALDSFREALTENAPGLILDADAYSAPWNLDFTKISHPVHFWHGTADQNLPFHMAKELAAMVPKAIPHWIEGEGHYSLPIQHSRDILLSALEVSL